jgi:phytoene/squalene synthetase
VRPYPTYQAQLERVSRSFALCIPQLAPPFRDHVALAYLLLRVLDTVEDAPFADRAAQQAQFDRMREFLRAPPDAGAIAAFIAAFPDGLVDAERELLADSHALLADAHALSPAVKQPIFTAIARMSEGMAAYARRPVPFQLVDLEDVTRYCCFVAGLVGEMLTRLWRDANGVTGPALDLAYEFGVFLQKVNILKDQPEDERAGKFFVPDRRELLASLRGHARAAIRYLQSLPIADRGYRTFCAWSLMLAATTIAELDRPRMSRREDTARLLHRTSQIIDDNDGLAALFSELMPRLPDEPARPRRTKPESLEWFTESLAAPLSPTELRRLGIALP